MSPVRTSLLPLDQADDHAYTGGGSACVGSAPEPDFASQHPGSPRCPQQLLRVRIFVQLLAKTRCTLRPSGIGAPRFEKTAFKLGKASFPLELLHVGPGLSYPASGRTPALEGADYRTQDI